MVAPLTNGSYRNHCPVCLWSKHVDIKPGDRASDCLGMMQPERMDDRPGKGLVIIHHCVRCGLSRANRIARDTIQEDDISVIIDLMGQGLG